MYSKKQKIVIKFKITLDNEKKMKYSEEKINDIQKNLFNLLVDQTDKKLIDNRTYTLIQNSGNDGTLSILKTSYLPIKEDKVLLKNIGKIDEFKNLKEKNIFRVAYNSSSIDHSMIITFSIEASF